MYTYKLLIYNFNGTIYLDRYFFFLNIIFLFYRIMSNFEPVQIRTDEIY